MDVWIAGWHVAFPGGGQRPDTPTQSQPPADAGTLIQGVITSRVGKAIGVRYGDWIALVGDSQPRVMPVIPETTPSSEFLLRLYHRRVD